MQLIQYPHVSSFSTVITNEFIGEDFYLSQHSMDGYEALGFDVTQLTQDMEQSLFTIKTNMPIPVLVYGDAWYGARKGGSKSNAINLILSLFLYHILNTMSS